MKKNHTGHHQKRAPHGLNPMGRLLCVSGDQRDSGGTFQPRFKGRNMNSHLKAYAYFLLFGIATKVLVVPLAKTMNIPYVKDL